MKFTILLILAVFAFGCCQTEKDSKEHDITGTHVREYSSKVIHPETGKEIRTRTVRDTIFIRRSSEGFEVSNSKWRLNNYDIEGWENMEHAEDRPMARYRAKFDPTNRAIVSEFYAPLYLNAGRLHRGREGSFFIKVNDQCGEFQLSCSR